MQQQKRGTCYATGNGVVRHPATRFNSRRLIRRLVVGGGFSSSSARVPASSPGGLPHTPATGQRLLVRDDDEDQGGEFVTLIDGALALPPSSVFRWHVAFPNDEDPAIYDLDLLTVQRPGWWLGRVPGFRRLPRGQRREATQGARAPSVGGSPRAA